MIAKKDSLDEGLVNDLEQIDERFGLAKRLSLLLESGSKNANVFLDQGWRLKNSRELLKYERN